MLSVKGWRHKGAALLLPVLLSACERTPTVDVTDVEPVTPVTAVEARPALPESTQPESTQPAETQAPAVLDLTLTDRPAAVPASPAFGAAPDSAWLDPGPAVVGTGTGQQPVLADVFGERSREKPVSVKGRMRLGEDGQNLTDTLDGAEVSIEIKTD